jgi:GTP cyclohydrolase II
MFLHLYQNDVDNKEHLAIVFGNSIRSRSLDAERPGETEMDRMIRGAYVGRLRPGRVSSRVDGAESGVVKRPSDMRRKRSGSALKNVQTVPEAGILHVNGGHSVEAQSHNSTSAPEDQQQQQRQHHQQQQDTHINTSPQTTSPPPQSLPPLKGPLIRIHSECYTGETAWSARCDCGEQLDEAARLMSLPSSTGGVIVYLRQEGRGIGLASKLKAYNLQDLGNDTVEANLLLRHPADARSYGLATSILCDLGLGQDVNSKGIRLLTNNPDKVRAVEGPGKEVRVRERVAMVPLAWRTGGRTGVRGVEIEKYLETKIGRMGHRIYEEREEDDT